MPPPLCPCARLTPRVAVVGLVLAALLVNVGCFLGATVGAATALQSGGGGSAPAPARENQPPAATNIQVTATTIKNFTSLSGDVTVKFSLQDVESEAVTLSIQYSDNSDGKIENGAWVDLLQTGGESIAGKSWATTPPPGTPYTFIWNSGEQLAKQQKKNLYVRVLPYDAKQKTGVGVVSVPFNIDNNDIPVVKVTTPSGAVIKGVVDVAYQIADPNSDAVNVVTQYSTDGGRDFANATAASGSEGVANLTSSPAGEAHVFKWDTLADLSRVTSDEVQVRITPSDIKQGVSGTTESFTVANNDAPALSALAVQGITNPATDKVSGDVPVTFVLTDSHSDPIAIAVEYSTGGDTWRVATPRIGTKITGLSSSPDDPATPAVEGAGASFVWDTVTDLQESYQKTVSLRVTPRDARDGGATVAYPSAFIVDNNSPPEAALLASYAGVSRRGDVFITYKLSDKHSDLADVAIEFSTDGGGTFTAALEDSGSSLSQGVSKRTTSPTGVQSLFVWDSAGQIAGVAPAVTVRITPKDTTDNSLGVPVTTDAFTVDNTNPPVVTVATPSASSGGQTPVAYFLTDTESNAASITVEFSLNAGATYAAASRGAGGDGTQNLSTSSTGVSHVFVWNSLNDVGVTPSSQVRLRFTPTDTLTGASVITPVFTVDNSALAAGDAPPIITIANVRYSIDGGATYLPVEGATASKWVKVAYNLSDNGGDPDVFDDGDPASLTVEYSKDFGSTFSAATEILPAPSVTGLAPSSGLNNAAAAVTISGGAFAGATAAALDDPAATALTGLVVVDPRTITASVPAGVAAGVYNVKVTTARGTNGVSFPGFTAISSTETAPVVTDVTPAAGQNSVETSVTVVGKNFTGATAAALDDGAATPLTGLAVASDGALTAKVPAGVAIGAYNVKVTNAAGTNAASSRKFSVTSGTFTPVVERVVPAIAGRLAATAVAIHGAGFTGATAVTLGDAAGTALTSLTALSDTEIRASVPAGVAAGNWQVKVTGAGGLTNAASGVALTVSDSDGTLDLVTSPYPGTAHGFLWDSQADVGPNFVPGVVLRFTAKDKNGTGIAATTAAFPVDNNVAPALAIDPVSGTKSLDISFTYLLTDPESNLVSLTPQYSIDDGATWKAATTKTGAPNGTTAITSAPAPGVSRAWVWASATDIGAKAYPAARVRLTPADAVKAGQAQTSNSFAVDNNTAPIVSLISTPSGVQRGDVTIQYELKDSASDPASIVIEYSIDGGATWLAATLTSGATTNLATSPTGVLQSLVWNSAANLGATATAQAKFRVTPSDAQKTGVPVATNNFTIYNATPPSVSVQTPQGVQNNAEGTVDILYTLSDAESNTASIFVEFSVNGGVNWSPASQAPGGDGTTGLVPGNRLYKWNRLDAGPTPTNNARVRITPTDELPGATAGAAGSTGDFSVDNQGNFNFPPSVANLSTPSGLQSDDIAFTYDISDPDTLDNQNSTLRVVVEYKKTSASTWSVATVTGQVDNLSSGTGKTFTWRSRTDQDNQNTTYQVRITAYDRPVGFTGNPPMQQSGALASGSFQVDHLDPVVAVTYPNVAGILKKGGTSITITWTTTDANKDKVSIRLLDVATLPGTVIATVASGIADTGSLAYVLPVVDNSNLKIEVTAVDKRGNTGVDMSDNVFQIDSTPPVVDLTYPENLDLLMTSVAYSITWTSTELNKYQARIDYNTTGDFANTASTVTLFNGITDNGSVSWTPSTSHISTTGRLRVMAWDKVSNLSSFNVGANTFEVRSTISTKTYTWTSTSDFDTFSRGAVENNYPADALTISKRFSNAFHYYGAAYAVDSLRGNSNIYVVGVYPGLLYTRDGGATFTRMNANSENKLPNSAVSAVSFLHDGVGDTFLAGGSSSGLCLTRDRGATWTVWTTATKPGIPSNSVRAVDFYDRDTSGRTFIVATSAGAAVTYDGGQTFTWYTSPTIPSSDVYDVEFYSGADASGPDNFLIGTTGGAARTANRGASFQSYTTATSPALDSTNWVRGVDYFEGYTSPYGSNGTRFAILTTKSGVYGARIHLENNGNTTAWEMVRRVEEVMVSSAENSYRVDFCDDDTGADTFLVATNGGLAFWRDNSSSTPTTVWTGGEWGSNSVYDVKFRSGKGFTETGEWMATTGAGCRKTTNAGSSNFDAIGAAQRIHSNDVRSVSIYSGGGAPGTTILIGTYGQGAYWSSDGGATLTRIIGNLPGNEALSCDIWDGGNQGRTVAIGTKDGLFTTQQANQGDAGSKITTTSFSLGNNDVYGVKYWDRGESDSKLVIGTEKGGYHSSDRGASMDQTFSEGNGSPQLLSEKVRGVAYFSGDATALTYAFATIFNPNGFGSSDDRDGGINYTNNDGAQFTKWGTANGVPHRDVFSVDMLDVTGGGVHILSATTGGVFVTHDFNVTRKTFAANYATAVFSSDDLLGSTWFYGGASGTGLTINDGASFYPVNGGTNPPMNGTATSIECQKGTANSTFIIGSSGGAYLGPVRYVGTGVFRVMRADPMVLIPTGGTFLKWRSLSYNGTVPASTAVKYQFYKSDGTLVPDSAIAGNSTGITLAPAAKIDLTLLTAASYPTLTIVGVMTTSVSNGTPTVNDITLELDFQN